MKINMLFLLLLFAAQLDAAKPSAASKYAVAAPMPVLNEILTKKFPEIETEPNKQETILFGDSEIEVTALQYAINFLGLTDVQAVLGLPDIDVNFPSDYPPLRLAIEAGSIGMVQALLMAGANPNIEDEENKVPLVRAAEIDKNSKPIIEALITAGAKVSLALTKTKTSSVQDKLRAYLKPQPAAAKK